MREKQISEIAKILTEYEDCGDCKNCYFHDSCEEERQATNLYNAGYRKQSEGEWRSELVKKCDWKGKKHDYYQPNSCSLCHEAVLKRTAYCPNCGAKMKGGE
jgi:hypothetical protein